MKYKKIFYILIVVILTILFKESSEIISKELSIEDVVIEGCKIIRKQEVEAREEITTLHKKNILRANISKVREDLMNLPMVEEIIVKKEYPQVIKISILEREPLLLILNNKQYYFYDKKGDLVKIIKEDLKKYDVLNCLPYVEGENILNDIDFISEILLNQKFTKRVTGVYKIGGRRWDMIIDKKIKIMLPEIITRESLTSIINLLDVMKSKNNVKISSAYTIFDARIKDKIFVKNIGESV